MIGPRHSAVALAALALIGTAQAALAEDLPAPAVTVAAAMTTELSEQASFSGRVTAVDRVEIFARVTGLVEDRPFIEGARVTRGDTLYRIEDADYRAAVAEIEGSIAAAEAERKLAVIERDRKAELVQSKAVAQVELDTAEAQLGKVDGQIAQLRGALARATLQLSYTTVAAPFDGVASISSADLGALVGPDSGSLTTLTRLDPIEVVFPVAAATYLEYEARVARGEASREATATLLLPDGSTYPSRGTINYIGPDVSQSTDTVTVRAIFDNPDGMLLDGALVSVTLESTKTDRVLTIPVQAVQRDQQGAFAMVVADDGTVEQRRIDVARTTNGLAVVARGLKGGENVITDGVNKVRPGVIVDAAPLRAG